MPYKLLIFHEKEGCADENENKNGVPYGRKTVKINKMFSSMILLIWGLICLQTVTAETEYFPG